MIAFLLLTISALFTVCLAYNNGYGGYGGGGYGGGYPAFPAIPWFTSPQRWSGQPVYLPSPPIYAMGVAQDQTTGFANFRYDYFYDHSAKDPTTVAPGAPGAPVPVTTSTASSNTVSLGGTGRPCTALSASNVLGAKDGICINHDKEGQCPSGAASDGAPCSPISEICCVHQANAKTVINEAVKAEIKAEKAA